jgi:hypothetical protein
MTNIALIALAMTLAAEPSPAPSTPDTPAAAMPSDEAAPAQPATPQEQSAPPPPAPAPEPPPPPAVKIPEDQIEELSEVVDLQEQAAADPSAAWYGKGYPERIRILGLPTARPVRKGGWDMVIDHRSGKAIWDKTNDRPFANMANNFLGFDGPMNVGLGLRYGVIDNLDVGAYRTFASFGTDTYEFDARYLALHQEDVGVDVAVRAGLSWFSQPDKEDATGYFGQLLVTRLLFNRLLLTGGAFYHSNSTNSSKYNQDKKYSVAGAGGAEVRLAAPIAVDAEVVACTSGYCSKNPAFSGGVKFFTNRHTFALVCGNTQYLTSDWYITNTDTKWKALVIGFNITREY